MDLNYYKALIAVADDCPVSRSTVSVACNEKLTMAARLRDAFFAKPQVCLRTSPQPKRHGWSLRSTGA